ncbi:acyclic terpene utilization AtuA family protein [Desulfoluna sp.]|uniref:acyclic terpene utilization AtuA family protein n=1 Tax=Desulfoluna sp. TaxID=2045199 RepID=UPI002633A39C|nr:acyclic terpene utilization AtuA family protein [Desulfoluna sp.]
MPHEQASDRLIIANCSGFFGDRFSAMKEMVEGGEIHVLTGDYLAELTMALLFKSRRKDPSQGYAGTFLKQMEQVMGTCLDRGIRVVANAGGLNPKGLCAALEALARELGLSPVIACIEGDDLMPNLAGLQKGGEEFIHLDRGTALSEGRVFPITANAYLGGWGVAEALGQGADIVIGGRLADAALVSGPSAWHFGWKRNDWDALAGAVAAGHIIECGTQATGGNYSHFEEIPSWKKMGFPLAIMEADGSSVITKHRGTGGLVSVGTVTAQLLYEIESPAYLNPDVTARFDTLQIQAAGKDQVRLSGCKGTPPPATAKVCINTLGGYRNSVSVLLTGLDLDEKARIVTEMLFTSLGGRERFASVETQLLRSGHASPHRMEEAMSLLRITVRDPDEKKVGRAFTAKVVELALSSIPGFNLTAPPAPAVPEIIHWPTLIDKGNLCEAVHINHQTLLIDPIQGNGAGTLQPDNPQSPALQLSDPVALPFGRLFATRSGDKGGNANLGVWAKTPEAFHFLEEALTPARLKELLPDLAPYPIDRWTLPNLKAVNFYIRGLLGDGVAASSRIDAQAKTLGEYLRCQTIEVPTSLIKSVKT